MTAVFTVHWIHFKNCITVYFLNVGIYNTLFVFLLVKRSFRNQVCVKGYMLNKILLGNTRKKELKTTGICKPQLRIPRTYCLCSTINILNVSTNIFN